MTRWLCPLLFDRRGIAAVEFAIISPVLVVLLLGAIEFTYLATARSTLEAVTIKGGRLIAASDCPDQRQAQLRQTVDDGMKWLASADNEPAEITVRSYGAKFGDVGQPEPFIDNPASPNGRYDLGESFTDVNGNGKWDADMGKTGSVGNAGEVVSYEATFKVKSLVPFIATRFNDGQDHYVIRANTLVRNEPVFRTTGCTP